MLQPAASAMHHAHVSKKLCFQLSDDKFFPLKISPKVYKRKRNVVQVFEKQRISCKRILKQMCTLVLFDGTCAFFLPAKELSR